MCAAPSRICSTLDTCLAFRVQGSGFGVEGTCAFLPYLHSGLHRDFLSNPEVNIS